MSPRAQHDGAAKRPPDGARRRAQATRVSVHVAPQVRAALAAAEAHCVAAGGRWTAPRARVLQLLLEAEGPLRAYDLVSTFAPGGYTHPPTVYRALDFLAALGLAHHLQTQNRYLACAWPGRPHDAQFLICDRCGRIDEHPFVAPPSVSAAAVGQAFAVQRWVVELRGLCAACSTSSG